MAADSMEAGVALEELPMCSRQKIAWLPGHISRSIPLAHRRIHL